MPTKNSGKFVSLLFSGAFCACLLLCASLASAQSETILHQFQQTSSKDGSQPYAGLIADAQGRLYGDAFIGGENGNGTVFELAPPATGGGSWRYEVLYNFGNAPDGIDPRGNLVLDRKGNLYGTTQDGGAYGCGIVYELIRPATGAAWTESILFNFNCGSTGASPLGGVIFDNAGNLYGTTDQGGANANGTVFRLTPPSTAGNPWIETVVYSFQGNNDASSTYGSLLFAGHNTFYGLSSYGGSNGSGTLYEVLANGSERVLHSFENRNDGGYPQGAPVLDSAGNVYGETNTGGSTDNGVAFEFTPPAAGGRWIENVIFNFDGTDGNACMGLVFDSTGTLYGSCWAGGTDGDGVVFELTPPSPGSSWSETVLHSFTGATADGAELWGAPVIVNGILYGSSFQGGATNRGVVYAVTP